MLLYVVTLLIMCFLTPFIFISMIIDSIRTPDSATLKSLSSDWNILIQQLKNNSKSKTDLPLILSQRKSPLENYKNAIKLHQINSANKKTLTQKILDLSRKRKLSTINLNQEVIRHKRTPSQQLPILTEEQKELLASKQLTKRQKNPQSPGIIKKIDLANAKSIINQFKLFKKQTYNTNNNKFTDAGRSSPLKDMIKERKSKPKLVIQEPVQGQEKNHTITFDQRMSQMVKEETERNKKLSFELSQDSKSLKYRYTKQQLEERRQRDSIPSVLKRRKRQPIQGKITLSRAAICASSVESQKLIKYHPEEGPQKTSNYNKKSELIRTEQNAREGESKLKEAESKLKDGQKSVIPLKPMPQSHMKQRHYMPKKKISLRTISSIDNSPALRYQPWDNPEQFMQTAEIESCSFNL